MSLQARMSQGDDRLYNVNRDVAHNFGFVMLEVAKAIEEERLSSLAKIAKDYNVDDETIGKCMQSLLKFVAVQAEDPKESMACCLARCGFLDLPEMARVVVMAYLGVVTLGIHHRGVREATMGGHGPADTYKKLVGHGRKLSLLMKISKFRRRMYRWKEKIRHAWRTLMSRTDYES